MIPAVVDLKWVRGDDYEKFGRVQTMVWDAAANSGTGAYVPGPFRDLTGWTGLAQCRENQDSTTVLFSLSIELGNQTSAPGSFWIRAAASDTKTQTVLKGKWDLQWTTDTGKTYTYAAGDWELLKDTSRAP